MINYIFDKLLVEIQTSHEKLVKCNKKEKKQIMISRKKKRKKKEEMRSCDDALNSQKSENKMS